MTIFSKYEYDMWKKVLIGMKKFKGGDKREIKKIHIDYVRVLD